MNNKGVFLTSFGGDGDVVVEELPKLHVHVRCVLGGMGLPVLVGVVKKGNGKDDNDDCGRHFIMIRVSIAIQMIITVVERGPTLSLAFAFA